MCRSLDHPVFNILFPRVLQIIVVDGNIAVGKNEFSRKLAHAFDLRHYPSVSPERVYLDLKKNYDLRRINEVMPDSYRVTYFLHRKSKEFVTLFATQFLWANFF